MKIKDMPWFNRPGTRLKKKGASYLNDAELLAIILERGNKKENAIDLANRLLNDFGLERLYNTRQADIFELLECQKSSW